MKQLFFGLFLTFFISCNSSTHTEKQVENAPIDIFFAETDLGAFEMEIKLYLNARFSECGEWGGHNENMVIYAKADKEFYLTYQKFKVDCKIINEHNGTPVQQLELEKTLQLNQDNKKSISEYIQRMSKSKIDEQSPGHAGNSFSVSKSDSTLLIQVYDDKTYDVMSYNKLLTELKLPSTAGQKPVTGNR